MWNWWQDLPFGLPTARDSNYCHWSMIPTIHFLLIELKTTKLFCFPSHLKKREIKIYLLLTSVPSPLPFFPLLACHTYGKRGRRGSWSWKERCWWSSVREGFKGWCQAVACVYLGSHLMIILVFTPKDDFISDKMALFF